MARTREVLYAVVGTGDLALERLKKARAVMDSERSWEVYNDVVTRGRSLSTRIQRSAPSKASRGSDQGRALSAQGRGDEHRQGGTEQRQRHAFGGLQGR